MKYEENIRPDPDKLLSNISKEEKKNKIGQLKIFLGMAPGVGKTYAMLRSASALKEKGIDVVCGIIETHKRKETEDQIGRLEVLSRKIIEYKDKKFEEFDIDLALKRKPQLIIVDELAHTNISGSRNTKRYLDIMELLNAGIDVYTAVNIQHIESKSQTVKDITNVFIRETVPDSFLDLANEMVVIDLPPEDLIKRLNDGLIYATDQAKRAVRSYFQIGNLTALRELSLRTAAERVDKDLREYRAVHNIQEIWKSGHRLLVGIFASPFGENLIRATRNLADSLNAPWIGVYIDSNSLLTEEDQLLLNRNVALVQELGGEFIVSKDTDPVSGLIRIARQNNVTQIVVGKSARSWWSRLWSGGSVVDRLMRQSGDIDIYTISNLDKKKRTFSQSFNLQSIKKVENSEQIGLLACIVFIGWAFAAWLNQFIGHILIGFIFLLIVSLAGLFLSRPFVMLAAGIFALIHNFFFIPPLYTFSVENPEDFMMLFLFFSSASIIGHLTTRLKKRELNLHLREENTQAAHLLVKQLLVTNGIENVLRTSAEQIEKILHFEVIIVSDIKNKQFYAGSWHFAFNDKNEKAVMDWVIHNKQHAGRFTQTLSASKGYYIPLKGRDKIYGAVGINAEFIKQLEVTRFYSLENFIHQIASTLEREIYHDETIKLQQLKSSHRLYKSILDSVSHELKTPLATIKGCASALLDPIVSQNKESAKDLTQGILTGTSRLQRIVENMLDMSRIDAGLISPKISACSVRDVIQSAERRFKAEYPDREVRCHFSDKDNILLCDPILTDQAILNILHNSHMYSPKNLPIDISSEAKNGFIKIAIRDYGPGINNEFTGMIFEKFYRAEPSVGGGLGLGLSIVKNFIELQHGKIAADSAEPSGIIFSIFLPSENAI